MAPLKRSITISGHKTSLTLEAEFWQALKEIAATKSLSVPKLIEHIDKNRGANNLSSAVRVFVLGEMRRR